MGDGVGQGAARRAAVSGAFLDQATGRSHPYVAHFRRVAHTVVWSARLKFDGRWLPIGGGRLVGAGRDQDDFVVSELVRDSVLDSLSSLETDDVLAAGTDHPAIGKWLLAGAVALGVAVVLALMVF